MTRPTDTEAPAAMRGLFCFECFPPAFEGPRLNLEVKGNILHAYTDVAKVNMNGDGNCNRVTRHRFLTCLLVARSQSSQRAFSKLRVSQL